MKIIKKFLANVEPSPFWQKTRKCLHFLSLLVKLPAALIGFLISIAGPLFWRIPAKDVKETHLNRDFFLKNLDNMPIFESATIKLYCPVKDYTKPTGSDHDTTNQAIEHGKFIFTMSQLGLRTPKMENALSLFMRRGAGFIRGYKRDEETEDIVYDNRSPEAEHIIYICLGMLDKQKTMWGEGKRGQLIEVMCGTDPIIIENFEQTVLSIVNNDYANIDTDPQEDWAKELHHKLYLKTMVTELVRMKSEKAMWQPGALLTNTKALQLLAIIRTGAEVCKSKELAGHYSKLLKEYWYGFFGSLPIHVLFSNNRVRDSRLNVICAYMLARQSSNWAGRIWWSFLMLGNFLVIRGLYDGFTAGLIKQMMPWALSDSYMNKCKDIAYTVNCPNIEFVSEAAMSDLMTARKFLKEVKKNEKTS